MPHHPPTTRFPYTTLFRSTSAGSIFQVSRSISAKIGVAPAYRAAFAVAMNEYDGQITSSPRPTPARRSARCSAVVHEEIGRASCRERVWRWGVGGCVGGKD